MSAIEVKTNRLISVRSVVQLYPGPYFVIEAPPELTLRRGFWCDRAGSLPACQATALIKAARRNSKLRSVAYTARLSQSNFSLAYFALP
jgi:hypothetical protein